MALRKLMERLTKPVEEQDAESLRSFCEGLGLTPIDQIMPREEVRTAGEIRSVRIVPRAGAPALEVTVTDGRASLTAVFLGRRRIVGLSPGRRVIIEGVVTKHGPRPLVYNPIYTLLT